jgi:hypothetical protein
MRQSVFWTRSLQKLLSFPDLYREKVKLFFMSSTVPSRPAAVSEMMQKWQNDVNEEVRASYLYAQRARQMGITRTENDGNEEVRASYLYAQHA